MWSANVGSKLLMAQEKMKKMCDFVASMMKA